MEANPPLQKAVIGSENKTHHTNASRFARITVMCAADSIKRRLFLYACLFLFATGCGVQQTSTAPTSSTFSSTEREGPPRPAWPNLEEESPDTEAATPLVEEPQSNAAADEPGVDPNAQFAKGLQQFHDGGRANRTSAPEPTNEPGAVPVRIRLSTGVALAQTLPTGTGMLFSVDYRFERGRPVEGIKYVWVIQPARAQPSSHKVSLKGQGTLHAVAPQWRPKHGPFNSYVAQVATDGSKLRISPSLPMR